jgi:nitrate reductase NapE component
MQPVAVETRMWREALVFLFLCVIAWPVIASACIGTYALGWWLWFIVNGPPGAGLGAS